MDSVICFIDDSLFEHDLVQNEIAPAAPEFRFVQAYTFDEAKSFLKDTKPALFLLDLWGQDASVSHPRITPMAEVTAKIADFPKIEDVYAGLNDYKGDVNNEYLKRFFAIVDSWRSLFESVCDGVGQNRKYGLYNLKQVREHYSGVPGVFYTRKSLISDAVALFQAGADGLYIKPTGSTDEETRRLTRENAPSLVSALKGIMARFSKVSS